MDLPVAERVGLELVLLIDRHDLLELSLLTSHIRQKRPVLADELGVFPFNLVQSDALVLFSLRDLPQVHRQAFKVITLLRLQLLRQVLVERVLFLEEGELLTHLLILEVVHAFALLHLRQNLRRLRHLSL